MGGRLDIKISQEDNLNPADFVDVLRRSGLSVRRPVDESSRRARMLANSNLVVVARCKDTGQIFGVARSVTDFAYCCYLSDLAVDRALQGRGLGKKLVEKTREIAGPESMCLLLSSPEAMAFYKAIGMQQPDNAFLFRRER